MLGVGLSIVMDMLNPEKIVIGSVFTRARDLLWPEAEAVIMEEALEYTRKVCEVVPCGLTESVGDIAALTVADYYYELLETMDSTKYGYGDFMTTEPINCDEELKRTATADWDLCWRLIEKQKNPITFPSSVVATKGLSPYSSSNSCNISSNFSFTSGYVIKSAHHKACVRSSLIH